MAPAICSWRLFAELRYAFPSPRICNYISKYHNFSYLQKLYRPSGELIIRFFTIRSHIPFQCAIISSLFHSSFLILLLFPSIRWHYFAKFKELGFRAGRKRNCEDEVTEEPYWGSPVWIEIYYRAEWRAVQGKWQRAAWTAWTWNLWQRTASDCIRLSPIWRVDALSYWLPGWTSARGKVFLNYSVIPRV